MNLRTRQVLLAALALSAAFVGVWAALAPAAWYRGFPGLGMHWLTTLGPYNQHLSRDVGGLYLALLVLSAGAVARARDVYLVRLSGGAWTVFSAGHLAFHLTHLSMLGTRDRVLNVVALGGTLVIALALLTAPMKPSEPRAHV
ncbi:MAG: hypothetical protein J2O48_11835 [Solirubrobacterales bacterium]|nr:hypothetical protein [Solirubrobacterales bacterium]